MCLLNLNPSILFFLWTMLVLDNNNRESWNHSPSLVLQSTKITYFFRTLIVTLLVCKIQRWCFFTYFSFLNIINILVWFHSNLKGTLIIYCIILSVSSGGNLESSKELATHNFPFFSTITAMLNCLRLYNFGINWIFQNSI